MIVLEITMANGCIIEFERDGDRNFLLECIQAEACPVVSVKFARR